MHNEDFSPYGLLVSPGNIKSSNSFSERIDYLSHNESQFSQFNSYSSIFLPSQDQMEKIQCEEPPAASWAFQNELTPNSGMLNSNGTAWKNKKDITPTASNKKPFGRKYNTNSSSKGHERFIPSRKNTHMQVNFENREIKDFSSQMPTLNKANSAPSSTDQNDENSMSIASLYQKHVLDTSENSKILQFQNGKSQLSNFHNHLPSNRATTDEEMVYDENFLIGSSAQKLGNSTNPCGSLRKPKQLVITDSTKILDAPGLEDDYYLNLLHWSAQNVISIVLKNEVFGYNCATRNIFSLQKPDKFSSYKYTSVKFSKSGRLLAIGDSLGGVQIIDAETRNEVAFFQNHEDRVASLAWIDDEILASGSKDRNIICHDLRDRSIVRRYVGHRNEVCGLDWSFDQQSLASGGNDDKLFVWNIAYNNFQYKFSSHKAAVKAIAWSPHQHGLLASGGGSRDKTIRFWNIHSGKEIDCIETNSQVCSLAFSKNVNQFVSTHGFADNEIYVWQYPNPKKVKILQGHQQRVIYMALSPDQKQIVTGASDETLRFWNAFPDAPQIKAPDSTLKFSDLR